MQVHDGFDEGAADPGFAVQPELVFTQVPEDRAAAPDQLQLTIRIGTKMPPVGSNIRNIVKLSAIVTEVYGLPNGALPGESFVDVPVEYEYVSKQLAGTPNCCVPVLDVRVAWRLCTICTHSVAPLKPLGTDTACENEIPGGKSILGEE